jgi:hypothetical protein
VDTASIETSRSNVLLDVLVKEATTREKAEERQGKRQKEKGTPFPLSVTLFQQPLAAPW